MKKFNFTPLYATSIMQAYLMLKCLNVVTKIIKLQMRVLAKFTLDFNYMEELNL